MYDEFNRQLIEIEERRRQKKKIGERLKQAQIQLNSEQDRLSALQERLDKEEGDVKKLEGMSLASMFYSVLGGKDEKLKKERQEFLAAKLQYDECAESVQVLQDETEALTNQWNNFSNLESEYQSILNQKEQVLSQSNSDSARRLVALTEEFADIRSDAREIKEAIQAGNAALRSLNQVVNSLNSARNWGIGDMIGGGLIVTAIKHSKIDSARSEANQAQRLLRNFQRELADVQDEPHSNLTVEIGGFTKFADYFFDGLIFDWMVQSRINRSRQEAEKVLSKLEQTIQRLRARETQINQRVDELDRTRTTLIKNA